MVWMFSWVYVELQRYVTTEGSMLTSYPQPVMDQGSCTRSVNTNSPMLLQAHRRDC